MLIFEGEGKTGEPREKPLGTEKRTNNQLNQLVARTQATREASAITTTPSLNPLKKVYRSLVVPAFPKTCSFPMIFSLFPFSLKPLGDPGD